LLTVVSEVLSFRQEALGAISPRRSLTCGDENYVLSGRSTFSDGGKLEKIIHVPIAVAAMFLRKKTTTAKMKRTKGTEFTL
jgi:hypothetical protein